MSLINEALKRAKDAQQNNPPSAPPPQLRPIEAAPTEKSGARMTVPLIVVVCAIVGFFIVWQNRQKTAAREPAVEPKSAPTPVISQPKPPVQAAVILTPTPVVLVPKTPVPAPASSVPALKLQAIFFAPGRSTAIINGKTVRVGNTFRGYRVTAITEASITLVSGAETNMMILEQ